MPLLLSDMKEAQRNMASQNSTIIKLTTDGDVESISSNRLSPTEKETELVINDEEVCEYNSTSVTDESYRALFDPE